MYRNTPTRAGGLRRACLASPLFFLLWGSAHGAAFQLMEQNASGIGNAFAGSAAMPENASTVFSNPAGMTQLPGRHVSLGMSYIQLDVNFRNHGSTGSFAGAQPVNGGDDALIPNAYLTVQLSPTVFAGLGVSAPFGLKTDYPESWRGRTAALKTSVKTLNLNPSLAWKVNDSLSLGLGLSYQALSAEYSQGVSGVPAGALGGGMPPVALAPSTVTVDGDSRAWGWNGGAQFQLSEATRLGIAYRSRVRHHLRGNATCEGSAGAAPSTCALVTPGGARGDARMALTLPETWTLSVAHRLDSRWLLLADLSQTGWSSVPYLRIHMDNAAQPMHKEYRWRDSTRLALGVNYQMNDQWLLRAGVAHDSAVVSDVCRTPRLPDKDRNWLSLGVRYQPAPGRAVDVGFTHIRARQARVADTSTTALVPGSVLKGVFNSRANVFGMQYSAAF